YLPVVSTRIDIATWRSITHRLLRTLEAYRVPAIGFVNESKLGEGGRMDSSRVALLREWAVAGFELGNHTLSHNSLHNVPLAAYESDVVWGEPVTRSLLARHGKKLRYFRHPYLHTGRTLATKHAFEAFLDSLGYTVAPVTIDNSDWMFSRALDNARDDGDTAAVRRVTQAYVPYMERVTEFWEGQSTAILGREIPHVLLIHANAINADQLDELLAMYRRRGYRFIPLAEALRDSAYRSRDTFTGNAGISWIHRWAITRGVPRETYRGEPDVPADVAKLSRERPKPTNVRTSPASLHGTAKS